MNIVWDMGGTLLDTYTPIDAMLVEQIRAAGTYINTADVAVLTRRSIHSAFENLSARFGIERAELDRAYEALMASWETAPAPLMPYVHEVMDAVRTSSGLNLVVTHRDRESATTLINRHGLHIDAMICAPDGFPRKPDSTMYRVILEESGISADDTISVGDREIDVLASHGAGIRAALLETPGIPVTADADWHITDLRQLLELL